MYSRAVPMPKDGEDENEDAPLFDETKDMNNPDNFENFDNEEIVKK